jgi:F420-non-reducing hydrogenase iron-sulfur subunit
MSRDFEPVIVGFLCNWCSYTGADLAGTARRHYLPNVRIIRVMCSGRVEPGFVIKALHDGADGVLVAGCHPGDCHYQVGNYKALRRMTLLKKMLEQFGIEPERFRLEWISASEANRFVEVVNEMTEQIRRLGPLKLGHFEDAEASAAEAATSAQHAAAQ